MALKGKLEPRQLDAGTHPENAMSTAVLPLSRTVRVVALTASLLATTTMLSINLGLVHSYTSSSTAAADTRVDCSGQAPRLGEEMVPHESSTKRPS